MCIWIDAKKGLIAAVAVSLQSFSLKWLGHNTTRSNEGLLEIGHSFGCCSVLQERDLIHLQYTRTYKGHRGSERD